MTFLWNLLVFSPLLALGVLFLQIFNRILNGRSSLAQNGQREAENIGIEEAEDTIHDTAVDDFDPPPAVNEQPALEIPDREVLGELEAPAMPDEDVLPVDNRRPPVQRIVGAKKAKSLDKKSHRRAYHEWMQEQAAARKQAEEVTTKEEQDEILEKKRARALAEQKIEDIKREARRLRQEKFVEELRHREETTFVLQNLINTKSQFSLQSLSRERNTSVDAMKSILKPLLSALPGIAILTQDDRFIHLTEDAVHTLEAKIKERGKMSDSDVSDCVEELLK